MEDDLTWLVRVTGGDLEPWCEFIARSGCDSWACTRVFDLERDWFTRAQYLARRAELQNKPSWADAPEWANWLCQRDDGMWFWCMEEPRVSENGWETRHEARAAYPSGDQIPEYVLGDWRDTLERRPVDLSEPALTARLTEATENVLAAAPALMDENDRNNWLERGELPPIGEFVDVEGEDLVYGDGELNCEVIAHVEDTAVIRMSYGLGCFQKHVLSPSRTERDKTIDGMKQYCPYPGSWDTVGRIYAEALYDAGYRKQILPAK